MQIENHVPSLETCKRMKELGWEKETEFNWYTDYCCDECNNSESFVSNNSTNIKDGSTPFAPLLSEILEALPDELPGDDCYGRIEVMSGGKHIKYQAFDKRRGMRCGVLGGLAYTAENPAEAAALLWCKLREEGIISSHEKE